MSPAPDRASSAHPQEEGVTRSSGQEKIVVTEVDDNVKTELHEDSHNESQIEVINFQSDCEDEANPLSLNLNYGIESDQSGQSLQTINVVDKKARMNPLAQGKLNLIFTSLSNGNLSNFLSYSSGRFL